MKLTYTIDFDVELSAAAGEFPTEALAENIKKELDEAANRAFVEALTELDSYHYEKAVVAAVTRWNSSVAAEFAPLVEETQGETYCTATDDDDYERILDASGQAPDTHREEAP